MAREIEYLLGDILKKQRKTIALAESCTGGLAANLITNVPGSSAYFLGGITTYSNKVKIGLLKIPERIINENGAVSRECATSMAQNIRMIMHSDIGLGITGIAGPGGGTREKPVGSVYIAVTDGGKLMCKLFKFSGDRKEIRQKASITALKMVKELFN